ncbi:glycerophosphodiester phosphodiesterase family protein [Streptosporangium sandarakinum]|uniref:glycerophosphodiester phosphodiesterase family protein n=1 Tax=Streptosporangium sandarakinum TaxID=1260955 RepID=UPI00341BF39B
MPSRTRGGLLAVLAGGTAFAALYGAHPAADRPPVTAPAPAPAPAPALVPGPGRSACADGTPIVIAHRGASALRPEHTLLAYDLAIGTGADYIECDLVSTRDHVLVARHENELSQTTDVALHPEFAARRTTKVVNGHPRTGWFTEDFTLAELRTLRARERCPGQRPGSAAYDGLDRIPTLDEIVRLAQRRGAGLHIETKIPSYFASIGLPLEEPLLATLARYGWDDATDPVFIQSFETGNLRKLHAMTRLRLIQFVADAGAPYDLVAAGDPRTYDDMVTPAGLREIARYADGVGVVTRRVVPRGPHGRSLPPTSLVTDAHAAGLLVHVSTVRAQNGRLPAEYRRGDRRDPRYRSLPGDAAGWLDRLCRLGVDGIFADDPGVARAGLDLARATHPAAVRPTGAGGGVTRAAGAGGGATRTAGAAVTRDVGIGVTGMGTSGTGTSGTRADEDPLKRDGSLRRRADTITA